MPLACAGGGQDAGWTLLCAGRPTPAHAGHVEKPQRPLVSGPEVRDVRVNGKLEACALLGRGCAWAAGGTLRIGARSDSTAHADPHGAH